MAVGMYLEGDPLMGSLLGCEIAEKDSCAEFFFVNLRETLYFALQPLKLISWAHSIFQIWSSTALPSMKFSVSLTEMPFLGSFR